MKHCGATLLLAAGVFADSTVPAEKLILLKDLAPRLHAALSQNPTDFIREVHDSGIAQMAPILEDASAPARPNNDALPIVITHGMGDSCFNPGMEQITTVAGQHMNTYSVCIPGGDNDIEDTLSAFIINMDKNIDNFAKRVRNDTKLANGFDAFGLSQGNSVLRGYIQRYNDPPVRNYLSIHGTIMGVAGFPHCNPASKFAKVSKVCDALDEVLGALAYNPLVQDVLFQANYFRDPMRVNSTDYLKNSQIAQWNNENPDNVNATLKANFGKVKSYSMIKALKDTMVYPNAGEWWGEYVPGQFSQTQVMNQTWLYQTDSFGLKTADLAGKFSYNYTTGNHLQFTTADLEGWLDAYFH